MATLTEPSARTTARTARLTVASGSGPRGARRAGVRRAGAVVALAAGALLASGATLAAATVGTAALAGHPAPESSPGWFYLD